ncbi:MAG TPA: peroxiredoxin [Oceanipulchritudo sp.]|nr:peroxiredoxin [Oceanipulchritudo sp.]
MKFLKPLILLAAMSPFSLFANDPLEVGQAAPALTITNQSGVPVDFAKLYAEGPVVVYFYPRADTPGCTKQACNIRDNYSELQEAGVTIIGVSTDSEASQLAFQEKYELPFMLIPDDHKVLGTAFGVSGYMGLAYKRQTFLVVDGKIAWRDLSARPSMQTEDILEALKALQGKAKE